MVEIVYKTWHVDIVDVRETKEVMDEHVCMFL